MKGILHSIEMVNQILKRRVTEMDMNQMTTTYGDITEPKQFITESSRRSTTEGSHPELTNNTAIVVTAILVTAIVFVGLIFYIIYYKQNRAHTKKYYTWAKTTSLHSFGDGARPPKPNAHNEFMQRALKSIHDMDKEGAYDQQITTAQTEKRGTGYRPSLDEKLKDFYLKINETGKQGARSKPVTERSQKKTNTDITKTHSLLSSPRRSNYILPIVEN